MVTSPEPVLDLGWEDAIRKEVAEVRSAGLANGGAFTQIARPGWRDDAQGNNFMSNRLPASQVTIASNGIRRPSTPAGHSSPHPRQAPRLVRAGEQHPA